MKAIRIAVVTGVLVGVVAATVHAALINANVTGKITSLNGSEVVTTKNFSSKDVISLVTTSKTAKLVIDDNTGALEVVDKCGTLLSNVTTQVGTVVTVGPDANSNKVEAVLLSFFGTSTTNGEAVVTISDKTTFKASETFSIAVGGKILTGKITTSSAFKPSPSCL